jgi:hypothetical protein
MPTLLTVTEALRTNLGALRKKGRSSELPLPMTPFEEFKKFIGFPEMEAHQREFMPAVARD